MSQPSTSFSLLSCGSNSCGQLGIGHKDDVDTLQPVLFQQSSDKDSPDTVRVTRVVAGGNHTLLLTHSGEVYWSGDSPAKSRSENAAPLQFSRFDIGAATSTTSDGWKPPFHVSLAAATLEASIFVVGDATGQTKVWSCGIGRKGELGLGELRAAASVLSAISDFPPPGTKLVDLSASLYHVVAVLDNGEAWGWGAGRKGQLGDPSDAVIWSPRRFSGIPFSVARAVCGREFTCFFGSPESGNIFIIGSDKDGIRSKAPSPSTVGTWKDVGASWHNVFVLKANGTLEGWGKNNLAQLPPANLTGVLQIAVGSEHAVALDSTGAVTAWGWGKHGECGPGGDGTGHQNVIAPAGNLPDGSKVVGIGAGWATSWVIVEHAPTSYHPN
ncbi:alpha-tubulin suppressor protein Aats1 [Rhypophila decipiens]|uniref:Alpha-tubulin suppressor protein Aats1 n=1 Tax=Rhypophila decipiens TaxID=261697 RepID=A0AAN7B9S7_9PEZI|nr:alpha-tubulin suppressor protein Aats1 [Rhypophila decipiens]